MPGESSSAAEAALAVAENRLADARRLIRVALEDTESMTDRGTAQAIRECLSDLMTRVEDAA